MSWTPNTVLVIEGLAVVDRRVAPARDYDPDLGRQVPRPALDLVGVQLFQVRDCAFVAVEPRFRGAGRAALRVYLPFPDTSAYFQRVERCVFRDWPIGIAYGPDSNTFAVRDCEFHIPQFGTGVWSRATDG